MKWKKSYENCVKKVCEQFKDEKLDCTYDCDHNVGWCDVYFRLEKVACVRWYVDTQEIYFIHCPTKWVFVNRITNEEKVWELGDQHNLNSNWVFSPEKSQGETFICDAVDKLTDKEIKQKIIGWADNLKELLIANKKDKIEKRKQLIEKDFQC